MTEIADLPSVLDSLPQAVLVVNLDFEITYANSAAETIFHASHQQLAKYGLNQIMPENSPVLELVEQVFREQSPVNTNRTRHFYAPHRQGDDCRCVWFVIGKCPGPELSSFSGKKALRIGLRAN